MREHVFRKPISLTAARRQRDQLLMRAFMEWLEYGETRLAEISPRYEDERKRRAAVVRAARGK